MRSFILVTACLTSLDHARRVQGDFESSSMKDLASMLKAVNPEAAFQATGLGAVKGRNGNLATGKRVSAPYVMGEEATDTETETKFAITEVEAEIIAKNVREMYDIPFLPNPLERIVVKQAIIALDKAYPLVLDEDVYMAMITDTQDSNKVEEATIRALSDRIDIPIISKELQDDIVDKILTVMYTSASAKAVKRKMVARATRQFLNTEDKDALATELNDMFDIPLVSEEQEQWAARKMVDAAFAVIRTIIPRPILDVMQSSSPEELRELRKTLIQQVNAKVDIPFQNEEQEENAISAIVDFFLKRYGLFDLEVLTPEEQKEALQFKLDCVETELEAQRIVAETKEDALLESKADLEAKLKALTEKKEE